MKNHRKISLLYGACLAAAGLAWSAPASAAEPSGAAAQLGNLTGVELVTRVRPPRRRTVELTLTADEIVEVPAGGFSIVVRPRVIASDPELFGGAELGIHPQYADQLCGLLGFDPISTQAGLGSFDALSSHVEDEFAESRTIVRILFHNKPPTRWVLVPYVPTYSQRRRDEDAVITRMRCHVRGG